MNAEPEHQTPEHLKPVCDRCKERGERYALHASGRGTIDEIREAITALEVVRRQGLPLGQKVKIDGEWHCPRCTAMKGDENTPMIAVAPNRAARRAKKTRVTKK